MNIHSKLQDGIDNLPPYVDSGGCGFTALYLYRALRRKGFNARIVAFDYRRECLKSLLNPRGRTVAYHYAVEVEYDYYDASGLIYYDGDREAYEVLEQYCKYYTEISEEKLKRLIKRENLWNSAFDRSICNVIKIIRAIHRTIE